MTDQLPRAIPTDPAEQERLMPEWVKDEWVRSMNAINPFGLHWRGDDLACGGPFWPHALTIWQWMPEPVDPDLQMAREVCAELISDYETTAAYRSGSLDNCHTMLACLAMAKRVREAKQ